MTGVPRIGVHRVGSDADHQIIFRGGGVGAQRHLWGGRQAIDGEGQEIRCIQAIGIGRSRSWCRYPPQIAVRKANGARAVAALGRKLSVQVAHPTQRQISAPRLPHR